jgi:acyl-homoserine lactone acylase PvdQ
VTSRAIASLRRLLGPRHAITFACAALVAACSLEVAAVAGAAAPVAPYGTDNYGHFFHVIPPGQQANANAMEAATFLAGGAPPAHSSDQRDIYTDLLYATPGLRDADIGRFFPDATFGVRAGDEQSTQSPRDDVTIVRDSRFGFPHIYGTTRSGTMFGAGYASAADHLFMMDVLRNAGAATLSSFVGSTQTGMDEETWAAAPYTDADRARQIQQLAKLGPDGAQVVHDTEDYVAGVNEFIRSARNNPTLMPVEFAAAGHPSGPRDWTPVDVLDVATLIGSQLGNGGGDELAQAERLQADLKHFGARRGYRVWRDLREPDDPEAPVTATAAAGFPYDVTPRRISRTVALPDAGSLKPAKVVAAATGSGASAKGAGRSMIDSFHFPRTDSNALLVSAAHSASGHPLAVMGSQAGYFSAEIWRYQDIHGPGIDMAGANIPGTGPYVEIGHGPDYAWSATSASQDIIDVYAVDLCNADGSKPSLDSDHYRFHGRCLAMETLDRSNSWSTSVTNPGPAGSQLLRVRRTKLGIVVARATIKGRPVAYTQLRSTYNHELDSAIAFVKWNSPDRIRNVRDFQHAAFDLGYTFNWLYIDDRDIGYINTGANPVRARTINGQLPQVASSRTEWKGWDPETNNASYQPFKQRPQAINQPYLVSWNNKQAHHCCGNGPYTPIWRSQSLTDAIDRQLAQHGNKISLANLVDAAEFGATVDLRGFKLFSWALKVIGKPADPKVADAVAKLRTWIAHGAPRLDRDKDGHYEDGDAVRIADAWMLELPKAVFEPRMGKDLFELYDASLDPDTPNSFHSQRNSHLGSSWEDGWFGFLQKDLRTVLGRDVKGRWSVRFCGNGKLARCRAAVAKSLADALRADPAKLYADATLTPADCGAMDQQACYDAIRFVAVGAVTQPLIPWQNRPTQQQVVEIDGHRPR